MDEYGDYDGRRQDCDAEGNPIDSDAEDDHSHTEQASHSCSKQYTSLSMGNCR